MSVGVCIAATVFQEIAPGKPFYHSGWYALVLGIAMAGVVVRSRSAGALPLAGGALLIGAAGLASGLLGPDTQEYVGAPGSMVPVRELGVLRFSLTEPPSPGQVVLSRSGKADTIVFPRAQAFAGSFILRGRLRAVVHVDVSDEGGNHLTLTQPDNPAFLSPFLLFVQTASVAGKKLPVDSFIVPAKRILVKAVLFDVDQLDALPGKLSKSRKPAVLYAVQSENGTLLPHGVKVVASGFTGTIAGLRIQTLVERYPAIDVASAPPPALLIAGLTFFAGGLVRNRFRS